MSNKVTIYTMGNCPYCTELKELYDKENIEYRNVDIDLPENKEEVEKILESSKAEEVPIVRIDKQLFIPNVSFKTIVEAVELTKRFLD
jgi:glutaredoxin